MTPEDIQVVEGLKRDKRHSHYWIDDEVLYETYQTIRGVRYRRLFAVLGMKDDDNCSPELLNKIELKFLV